MLAFWSPQVKVNTIALRYFNPVGADPTGLLGEDPRNTPTNLVPVITGSAIGNLPPVKVFGSDYPTRDGSCIRDYVHVNDIADAHIKALLYLFEQKNSSFFDIINLGTGNGVTVLEMIYAFEQVTQQKLQYELSDRRAGDVAQIYSNPQKAQKLLNWFPKYDVYQMMESAWKWQLYLKHEN
jgi:UDP-glucose 4-epimerase